MSWWTEPIINILALLSEKSSKAMILALTSATFSWCYRLQAPLKLMSGPMHSGRTSDGMCLLAAIDATECSLKRLDCDSGSQGRHQHAYQLHLAQYYVYHLNAVIKPCFTDPENHYNYTINEVIEIRGIHLWETDLLKYATRPIAN